MVVSTRLTPRKSERGMGKLVEESEGGSALPRTKKNNAKSNTTTPMKSSSRQQKSKATPLPKTTKRGRPPTPVPSARKDRTTTPTRSNTKKNGRSIPVTSSSRKSRPIRTPSSRTKSSAETAASSSPDVQPHTTEERIHPDNSQVTPPNDASPLITPQSKLPLNPTTSSHISKITLGRGKSATPLKEWRIMDATRLKSLLKSRKRADRESAMAQLSFDGTPLEDMIYSDLKEVLEYMKIKVKKGNTAEELKLILAEIMIEAIEESMYPMENGDDVQLDVSHRVELDDTEEARIDEQQQEGNNAIACVADVEHGLTEQQLQQQEEDEETEEIVVVDLPSSLSPGTDVTYKGICVGDMTNVQLHDYLVELDMKHGGSKGIRAARLREGLFRLKSETLAGIYNGKPFDDMSEFELREALKYEGEPADGTLVDLRRRLMELLFNWANNDVHLIRKDQNKDQKNEKVNRTPKRIKKSVAAASIEKNEEVVITKQDDGDKGTMSTMRHNAAVGQENVVMGSPIPDLNVVASDEKPQRSIESVEDSELQQNKGSLRIASGGTTAADVSIVPAPNSEEKEEEGTEKQQQSSRDVMEGMTGDDSETAVEGEGFIHTNHVAASSTVVGEGLEKQPLMLSEDELNVVKHVVGSVETMENVQWGPGVVISATVQGEAEDQVVGGGGGGGRNSRTTVEDGFIVKIPEAPTVDAPITVPAGDGGDSVERHTMGGGAEEFPVVNQEDLGEESDQRITSDRMEVVVEEKSPKVQVASGYIEKKAVETYNDRGHHEGIGGVETSTNLMDVSAERKSVEEIQQDIAIPPSLGLETPAVPTEQPSVTMMRNVPLESDSSSHKISDDDYHHQRYAATYRHNIQADRVIMKSHKCVVGGNDKGKYSRHNGQSSNVENSKNEDRVAVASSSRTLLNEPRSPLERLTAKQRSKFLAAVQGRATITPEEFDLFSRALGRAPSSNVFHHEVVKNNDPTQTTNHQQPAKQEDKNLDSRRSTVDIAAETSLHYRPDTRAAAPSVSRISQPSLSTRTRLIGRHIGANATPCDLPPRQMRTEEEGRRREDTGRSLFSEKKRARSNSSGIPANKTDTISSRLTATLYEERTKSWNSNAATKGVKTVVDHSLSEQQQKSPEQPVTVNHRRRRVSYGPCTGGRRSGLQLIHGGTAMMEGGREFSGRLSSSTRFFPRVGTSSMSFKRGTNNLGMESSSSYSGRRIESMEKIPLAAPVSTRILAQQAVALRILEAVQSTISQEPQEPQEPRELPPQPPPLEKSTEEQVMPWMLKSKVVPKAAAVEHGNNIPSSSSRAPCPSSSSCSSLKNNLEGEFLFREPLKVVVEKKNFESFSVGGRSSTSMSQHDWSHQLFSFSGPADSAKRRRSLEMGNRIAPQTEKTVAVHRDSSNPTTTVLSEGAKNVLCKPPSAVPSSYGKRSFESTACTVQTDGTHETMNAATTSISNKNPLSFDMSQFGPKPGQWKCPSCSVVNDSYSNTCPCCETCKPDGTNSKRGSVVGSSSAQTNAAECNGGKVLFGMMPPPASITKSPTFAAKELGGSREQQLCGNSSLTNVANSATPYPSSGFKGFSFGTTSSDSSSALSSKDFSSSRFVAEPPIGGSQPPPPTAATTASLLSGEARPMMASAEGAPFTVPSFSKCVNSTGDKLSAPSDPFAFGKIGKTGASGGLLFAPPIAGGNTKYLLTFGTGPKPSLPVPSLSDLPQSATTATVFPPFKQHG